jgi:hypothetical protein
MMPSFRTPVLQCETTFHIESQPHFNYNAGRVKGTVSGRKRRRGGRKSGRVAEPNGKLLRILRGALAQDHDQVTRRDAGSPQLQMPGSFCSVSDAFFAAGSAEGRNRKLSS